MKLIPLPLVLSNPNQFNRFLMMLAMVSSLSVAVMVLDGHAHAQIFRQSAISHPEIGYQGMVSSQDTFSTKAAADVLAEGGNAIDAAVTAGFTMAVTLPRAGNIGGGGFMLIHNAKTNQQTAIDYREQASSNASQDMFLDDDGNPVDDLSQITHLAAGVPGTVRGFELALKKYGTIDLARALGPAIELAEQGFPVSEDLHESLLHYQDEFALSPEAQQVFYQPDGSPWPVGAMLVQKDLAASLRLIAENGADEFYEGSIAKKIVADMRDNKGIINAQDMKTYEAVEREPLQGSYRGLKVVSMPPPSSGGTHLIQMLNILERFPMEQFGHNSADSVHVMTEAMRMAYADRSKYLGDPGYVSIPMDRLTSKKYALAMSKKIDMDSASPSLGVFPGTEMKSPYESHETTHFSVIDATGNAVSNTYTLNFSYGSKLMVPGTGILLNNQMDDFSSKPGAANAYGLIGGKCNAIEPGKRMLSSMTPTFLFKEDGTVVATGSPGGSRIINVVLQMIVNMVDHNLSVAEATVAPRFHHQWFPDVLHIEKGFSPDTIRLLSSRGHKLKKQSAMGSTQTVAKQNGMFVGFSDLRRRNSLTLGVPKYVDRPARLLAGDQKPRIEKGSISVSSGSRTPVKVLKASFSK
jgi:gamma-glutamyltranspeptidase/glutathione hydrolase